MLYLLGLIATLTILAPQSLEDDACVGGYRARAGALTASADIILMPVSVSVAHKELLSAKPHLMSEATARVVRLKLV